MNRLLLTMAGVGLTTTLVFAQQQTVRGTVVSVADGEPIIGASVVVKGQSTVGAATDMDGKFTLNVPRNATTLVVTYVGYKTQEVKISNNMTIKLAEDASVLDDVVVVGYGVQKRESFVGSQTTVSAKNLAKRPITNATTALAGLTPGVQLTTGAGQPGASEQIIIRGSGSINAGANPVYVVDGTIYTGAIGDIAPSDIQSIDILKDAASTAIYGSSAGNGVVLITTKSGAFSGDSKPTFTFTMNQGISQRGESNYERLGAKEYYTTRWQQWYNLYRYEGNNFAQFNSDERRAGATAAIDVFTDLKYNPFAGIKSYYDKNTLAITTTPSDYPVIVMPDGTLNPEITGLLYGDDLDWEKALFRTGHRSEYNFSGAYNNDKLKSFFSLGYLNEAGYRLNTNFSRFNGRANVSYKFTKWLEMGTNLSFSRAETLAPKNTGATNSNAFGFVRGIAPIYPIHQHNADGSYVLVNGQKQYDYSNERPYSGRFNPVYESEIDLSRTARDLISNRSFVAIKPLEGLTLKANISYDLTHTRQRVRYNNIMGDQPEGLLRLNPNRYSTFTFNQLADYVRSFGKNNFSLLLGHESYDEDMEIMRAEKKTAVIGGIDELNAYLNTTALESYTDTYRKESYFGRLNYDYDGIYNASFSYRRDGSSRFDRDVRWGNFWSVGAGWNLHKESFLKGIKWLNQLKLRASYGKTGNDDLRSLADRTISSYYPYISTYDTGAFYANNDLSGFVLSQVGTPNLLWETQVNTDIALEGRLFNRFAFTLEFFNKESENLLFAYPRPLSSGVESTAANLGKVRNYGFEFDVKYDLISKRNLQWNIHANGTVLTNKIVRLPDANREEGIELSGSQQKYEEGRSIYEFYTREWLGVDPDNGRSIYRIDRKLYPDVAGIDAEDRKDLTYNNQFAAKHFAGSSVPKLQGGFGSSVTAGNFDASINFTYQLGGKTFDAAYASLMNSSLNSGRALHVDALNAWRKPGDVTSVPRYDAGRQGTTDNAAASDRFIISSDALMLKSISLGYTLPKSWLSGIGISSARLSIAGENLFMLTARKGLNPMKSFSGYNSTATYGYARTITTSLSITL